MSQPLLIKKSYCQRKISFNESLKLLDVPIEVFTQIPPSLKGSIVFSHVPDKVLIWALSNVSDLYVGVKIKQFSSPITFL